jgi:hypothetical protein
MSLQDKARTMRIAAEEVSERVHDLADILLRQGVSEKAHCYLKKLVYAVCDEVPTCMEDVKKVDGLVYEWNVEVKT